MLDASYFDMSGEERYNITYAQIDTDNRSVGRLETQAQHLSLTSTFVRSMSISTASDASSSLASRSPSDYLQRLQGIKRSSDSRRAHLQQFASSSSRDSGDTSQSRRIAKRDEAEHRKAVMEARESYARHRYAESSQPGSLIMKIISPRISPSPSSTVSSPLPSSYSVPSPSSQSLATRNRTHPSVPSLGGVASRLYETYNYMHNRSISRSPDTSPKRAMNLSPLRNVTHNDSLPVVFSDPVENMSVGTGLSQQELLRQKVRTKKKKQFKKKKKPKEQRILNLPSALGALTSPSKQHSFEYIRRSDESSDHIVLDGEGRPVHYNEVREM
jgi:hypothetical protein